MRQLEMCRQFYRLYPIANALRSQLNWTQYRMLIQIADQDKRSYYELEAVNNHWTARETERQINSMLYKRLLMSNDKEAVLAVARKERIPQSPQEIIKDPMYPEENPTIGILLCTDKNDTAVKMALPEDNKTILASEYKLYLPTQAKLIDEVNSVRKKIEQLENKEMIDTNKTLTAR